MPVDDTFEVVVDGQTPNGVAFDLFNTRAFHELSLPAAKRAYYFTLRHRRAGTVLGASRFLENDSGHFESPLRGSFGGFAIASGAELTLAVMEKFATQVELFLREQGARQLTIVLPPLAYHPHQTSAWINILLRNAFSICRHELSYAIEVGPPFLDKIDYGNRKQLKKCERAELTCQRLPPSDYEAAYAVVDENRRKKGNALSMTWPALREVRDRFPEAMHWFGVRRPGELIAAAVCMLINPSVLYVFYWGEIAGVETLSPVTLLASQLYEHCRAEKIALLDIGTSTLHGVPNHGLIRYKKNLGSTESLKLTMTKALT